MTFTHPLQTATFSPIDFFPRADIGYLSDAQAPSCAGQNVLADESGTEVADSPGTYTADFEFSCPAGQTLTASGPIQVELAETQSALGFAQATAQSAAANISARLDSGSVSYS